MNDANKKYYKEVYNKVYASDDLRERVLNMKENNLQENQIQGVERKKDRKHYSRVWKAAAAIAVLAVTIPSVVYAATRYWGVSDFFGTIGYTLTKEADKLIEKDIAVKTNQEMPVEFRVKEALCDSGSVTVVLEAEAKEKGKYLLVDGYMEKNYAISSLGIDTEETVEEYAERKGLRPLYVEYGFADTNEFMPSAYTSDGKLVNHDTLELYLCTIKESDLKEFNVAVTCAVRGEGDGKSACSTTLNFKLQDKSSTEKVTYAAKGKMAVKGTKAVVTKVTMEKTEVNTYVNIYYTYPDKDVEDGLFFRMRDKKGKRWGVSPVDVNEKDLGGGKYYCKLAYPSAEFPESCILEAFDCWELDVDKQSIEQFTIYKVK